MHDHPFIDGKWHLAYNEECKWIQRKRKYYNTKEEEEYTERQRESTIQRAVMKAVG
jgi:hypothetical protein